LKEQKQAKKKKNKKLWLTIPKFIGLSECPSCDCGLVLLRFLSKCLVEVDNNFVLDVVGHWETTI
jgi:hypothetical protein